MLPRRLDAEDAHRHAVVHAEAERGRVDDLQALLQRLLVGDLSIFARPGRCADRPCTSPSTPFFATSTSSALISSARCAATVSVEKYGRPAPAPKMTMRPFSRCRSARPRDVRLGDLGHRDGGLDAGLRARLLQEVLQGEGVHHRAEHAHVVGASAVHAALAELGAAEEVAAADDDRDLDPSVAAAISRAIWLHDVGVDAELAAAEGLTGQLQDDATSTLFVRSWSASSLVREQFVRCRAHADTVGAREGVRIVETDPDSFMLLLRADLEAGEAGHGEARVLQHLADATLLSRA